MPSRPHLRRASAAADWSRALPRVLRGEGVASHFQAIVDLEHGDIAGHEALLRLPGHAVSTPADWIAAAHAHGCGPELEAVALRTALAARAQLPAGTFLSVNVGPAALCHPAVRSVFTEEPCLDGVVVELTEHSRVEHYGMLASELDRLREAGAAIAVDDTGAGYAGLQHLLSIRPEMIKLDRSLVAGIDGNRPKRALVEMFRAFANRFDAWVVAEGVETSGELATLRRLGVPLAQGYLLARPAPRWQELSAEAGVHLAELAGQPAAGPTLRLLLEPAAATLRATRPVTQPHAAAQSHAARADERSVLRLPVDTGIAEAAHRALNRDEARRFDPLLCTDSSGALVGVVRMERIVEQLAVLARPDS
jgi:EAL domain-containing protein (putative c-di-GMP-specific phosphodiesterase class I)